MGTSLQLLRRPGTFTAQPFDQLAGFAALRRVERRHLLPRRDPVHISAASEEKLGGALLPAVACTPEGASHLVRLGRRFRCEVGLEAIHQPERRRVVEVRPCAPLDEPVRSPPLPERPRVPERRTAADDRAGCLDVGAGVEERVEHVDVVARRRPVQRSLGVRALEPAVDVSAPAATSAATVAAPRGKWPGQSVATCNSVRDIPAGFASPSRASARPVVSSNNCFNATRSPVWIALTTAMASGSSVSMYTMTNLPYV